MEYSHQMRSVPIRTTNVLTRFSYTYLNRFTTCLIFGALEILTLAMVTFQAASGHLHPNAYGKSSCVKGGIGVMFYASLSLYALGISGVRGSMTAFGADQFEEQDPNEAKTLASYFNWLLLSSTVGAISGVTGVVWASTQRAWHWGQKGRIIETSPRSKTSSSRNPSRRRHRDDYKDKDYRRRSCSRSYDRHERDRYRGRDRGSRRRSRSRSASPGYKSRGRGRYDDERRSRSRSRSVDNRSPARHSPSPRKSPSPKSSISPQKSASPRKSPRRVSPDNRSRDGRSLTPRSVSPRGRPDSRSPSP